MTAANRNNKTQVLNRFGTNTVSSFDYVYDELNRRTQRLDSSPASLPSVQTNLFDYNDRSELTSAAMSTNDYSYAYDSIGNRVGATSPSRSSSYTANELNQYTQTTDNSSTNNYTYDADGNLLTYNGWTFQWNGENRLIQAANATTVVTFKYDHKGRRFEKAVNATNTTRFVYDGWNLVSEIRSQGAEGCTNFYVWGLDLSQSLQGAGGVGGLLATIKGGASSLSEPYFPCFDANGNVTDYISTNGTIVARYAYNAYGSLISSSGSMADDFNILFSSKYLDRETGLSYYGYRYYSPELGRWLNRDPIEERGGVNLYAFVFNNNVDRYDYLGLEGGGCPCDNATLATVRGELTSCLNNSQGTYDTEKNDVRTALTDADTKSLQDYQAAKDGLQTACYSLCDNVSEGFGRESCKFLCDNNPLYAVLYDGYVTSLAANRVGYEVILGVLSAQKALRDGACNNAASQKCSNI